MSQIDDDIKRVSFEEAYLKIDRDNIDYLLKGDGSDRYPLEMKRIGFLLLSLSMPVMMLISYIGENKNIETTVFSKTLAIIVAMIFIFISLFLYIKSQSGFKYYRYKEYVYASLKVFLLSYFCGSIGTVNEDYLINLLTIAVFVPMCLALYYLVEKNMMATYLNVTFGTSLKTNMWLTILLKMSGITLILMIVLVQLYRINKWWLDNNSIENTINGLGLNMTITIVISTCVMFMITLIPTYFSFKADLKVQHQLVTTYAAEFKEVYGYYEEEWGSK